MSFGEYGEWNDMSEDPLKGTCEALIDLIYRKEEILKEERLLRGELEQLMTEFPPDSLAYRNYTAYFYKAGHRRSMKYDKLENEFDEQYQWLIANKILSITPPKKPLGLRVAKIEKDVKK